MNSIICSVGPGKTHPMPFGDFCYFKADCKYVTGVDDSGQEHLLESHKSLKSLMAAYPELIATHRSYVTARPIRKVTEIGGCLLAFGDGFLIPVSRRYAPAIRAVVRIAAAST